MRSIRAATSCTWCMQKLYHSFIEALPMFYRWSLGCTLLKGKQLACQLLMHGGFVHSIDLLICAQHGSEVHVALVHQATQKPAVNPSSVKEQQVTYTSRLRAQGA